MEKPFQFLEQEHISPVLMQLHWLKVPQRITFKIVTLTFLAIHGKAPTYICELVEQHTLRGELRSTSNAIMLKQPRSRTAAAIVSLSLLHQGCGTVCLPISDVSPPFRHSRNISKHTCLTKDINNFNNSREYVIHGSKTHIESG